MDKSLKQLQIPNGGYAVLAEYMEQMLEEYSSNPLIEALPPIFSYEQTEELLHEYPAFSEKERELDERYRYHCVQRLFRYFQPLSVHFDIEQRISRVIRQGYISRNPLHPDNAADMQQIYRMIREGNYEFNRELLSRTSATGFTIIGTSGVGKSISVEKILSLYPQIIVHSEYKGKPFCHYQLTWLKLDCPFDGSVKGLCNNFFLAFDRLLGDNTYNKYADGRNISVNTMMPIMAQLARNHSLGMLIIDEIQHLSLAKSGGSEKMLNFFVNLVNTIGVPVILIGTTKAMSILQSEFRQARRGSGQGDLIWERMKNDMYWELLLEGMWKYQWTRHKVELTKELIDALYFESQGIVDIAVKIFILAQMRAIASGKEVISDKLIGAVARENLKLVKPMLDALKSGDLDRIELYKDIMPVDINRYIEEYSVRLNKRLSLKEEKKAVCNLNLSEQVALKLLEFGIDEPIARKSIDLALEQNKNLNDITAIAKEAIKYALGSFTLETVKKTTRSTKKKAIPMDSEDLRYIVEEGKRDNLSAYEAMRKEGIIKDYFNDFIMTG